MTERKPRSRSRSAAKASGRQLENDLAACLSAVGLDAYRLRQKGSNDEGDVRAKGAPSHVFECKNTSTISLSTWWHETEAEAANAKVPYGWIVHKRHGIADPRQQWATTTTGTLADLLASIQVLEERAKTLEIQLSYATRLAFDKEPT